MQLSASASNIVSSCVPSFRAAGVRCVRVSVCAFLFVCTDAPVLPRRSVCVHLRLCDDVYVYRYASWECMCHISYCFIHYLGTFYVSVRFQNFGYRQAWACVFTFTLVGGSRTISVCVCRISRVGWHVSTCAHIPVLSVDVEKSSVLVRACLALHTWWCTSPYYGCVRHFFHSGLDTRSRASVREFVCISASV